MATNAQKSTYKNDVIVNNSKFKNAVRTTGKGLRVLKSALQGEATAKPMLEQIELILDDQKLYKKLDKMVRRIDKGDNKGKTCPFYILQSVYKMKQERLEGSKPAPKTAPKNEGAKGSIKKNNAKSLQSQTVPQLVKLAKSANIETKGLKKAELITAIKANATK